MVIKEFERVMWHVVRVMVVRRSALELYISTANQPSSSFTSAYVKSLMILWFKDSTVTTLLHLMELSESSI